MEIIAVVREVAGGRRQQGSSIGSLRERYRIKSKQRNKSQRIRPKREAKVLRVRYREDHPSQLMKKS